MRYQLDADQRSIYQKYAGLNLPRHTSYPAVPHWSKTFSKEDWEEKLKENESPRFSLYVHVPYCEKLCYYCGCTKTIQPKLGLSSAPHIESYLESIRLELDHLRMILGPKRIAHLHLGGGTPTYLSPEGLETLLKIIRDRFPIEENAELACEIDPRATTREHLVTLKNLGFNRLSLGVQDFHDRVQKAVNRIQPFDQVQDFVALCRELGFDSLNFDLIYGLPFQTRETIRETLDKVLSLAPDRIAFYRLAIIPEIFRWQKSFLKSDMPTSEETLDFNLMAIQAFHEAGYDFLGLDHFAKRHDPLSQAYRDQSLQRNFQGMSTGRALDIIGIGPSAISSLSGVYAQNSAKISEWHERLKTGLATEKGHILTLDDRIRQDVLQELYCYRSIDLLSFEKKRGMSFETYFQNSMHDLHRLEREGIIAFDKTKLRLTPVLGELLVRVVAATFDAHLSSGAQSQGLRLGSQVG